MSMHPSMVSQLAPQLGRGPFAQSRLRNSTIVKQMLSSNQGKSCESSMSLLYYIELPLRVFVPKLLAPSRILGINLDCKL